MSKIALTPPQTIPLDKLRISDANVRQIKAGLSIEALAASIARRGLLQSLSVRPILDEEGRETGSFAIQAGGRRYRALQLLVRQKRLAKTAPIPCIVKTEGLAEEDSLAENTDREALHPLDQFRAFAALRAKGQGEEEIAAAFGVTAAFVKQRMKLASASAPLLTAFEQDELTLDELMAFCLSDDHDRQNQVWNALKAGAAWNRNPSAIRRMLTEKTVAAGDKRARFAGLETYKQAGGIIIRDLFENDHGGWLQDPTLLQRLVDERLAREAETVRAEGWKWVEAALDFPWGHKQRLQTIDEIEAALSADEEAAYDALSEDYEALGNEHSDNDEIPDDIAARMEELDTLMQAYCNRSPKFAPDDIRRAEAFVSVDHRGNLSIERGYVRPEDQIQREPRKAASTPGDCGEPDGGTDDDGRSAHHDTVEVEDEGPNSLSDKLMTELTAHRTLGLRDALANNPAAAYLTAVHALALRLFYNYTSDTCLQIVVQNAYHSALSSLSDAPAAKRIDERHESWKKRLPHTPRELWKALCEFDDAGLASLFAHCVGMTVNAVHEPTNRTGRIRHAGQLAEHVGLDMVKAGWVTTADNYLSRVTKPLILEAVREAKGDKFADLLADHKKKEMALEAQRLLDGTGWLPAPLRTPEALDGSEDAATETVLPAFLDEAELQAAE